jgi:hypothetical protein
MTLYLFFLAVLFPLDLAPPYLPLTNLFFEYFGTSFDHSLTSLISGVIYEVFAFAIVVYTLLKASSELESLILAV